jgi:MFS family permease
MQTGFSINIVPRIGAKIGPRKMLALGLAGGFVALVGMTFSTTNVYAHIGSYLIMMIAVLLGIIGNRSQLAPIAQHTGVGSGKLASLSRLFMTAGQALCPLVTFSLVEKVDWWLPYAVMAALTLLLWPLYLASRVNLWNEPAPIDLN